MNEAIEQLKQGAIDLSTATNGRCRSYSCQLKVNASGRVEYYAMTELASADYRLLIGVGDTLQEAVKDGVKQVTNHYSQSSQRFQDMKQELEASGFVVTEREAA